LISDKILNQIVELSKIKKGENILEIGPGVGTLSCELVESGANLKVVELDDNMIPILENLKSVYDFQVIKGDILKIYLEKEAGLEFISNYRIISNLPYNISSHFLRIFLGSDFRPKQMILMLQKEVVERIIVADGKWSKLSLMCNYYSRPRLAFQVPKNSFYPVPRVDSAIIVFDDIKKPKEELDWRIINFAFSSKRRTLVNNLSAGLKIDKAIMEKIIESAGFSKDIRAEKLNIEDWYRLNKAIQIQKK
jgi:16S rRNA (adenine1518-N6/adenine1519-N6)-dimethyltransferase